MRWLNLRRSSFCFFILFFLAAFAFKLTGDEFPKEIWRYTTGGSIRGVAYDPETKRIFCGSIDKKLYCLNDSGKLIWSYITGGSIRGVAYDPETKRIFCGSGDKKLYCLNSSGELIWSYTTAGWVNGIAYDPETKRVFCGSDDKKLYCLNNSGEFIWSYATKDHVANIAYDPETKRVFCGSDDKKLYCLNYSGEFIWSYATGGLIRGIAYDPETKRIFCGSGDKKLYCLNSSGGSFWSYTTAGWLNGIAYDPETKRIFCGSGDKKLYCLNDRGKLIWHYSVNTIDWHLSLGIDLEKKILFAPLGSAIGAIQYGEPIEPEPEPPIDINKIIESLENTRAQLSSKVMENLQVVIDICPESFPQAVCTPISNDFIYSVELDNRQGNNHQVLYKIDPCIQKKAIKYFLPAFSPSKPILIDEKGTLYFVSHQGKICCYNQGEEFTLFDEYAHLSPTIGTDGLLYFSSKEGSLFCANSETKGIIWKQQVESEDIWSSPAVDEDGTAYFADKSSLYIVSMTGKLTQKKLSLPIASPLKLGMQGNLYFLSDSSTLTSIDPNGEVRWSYRIYDFNGVESPVITPPAFDKDGYIYVGSSNGKIYCINGEGKWVWQKTTKNKSPIEFAPISNEKGEVFFLSKDGELYRKRMLEWFEKPPFNWLF